MLTTVRANRIFEKLGFPPVRPATHFEEGVDEYGVKLSWVIDRGPMQALKAYATLNAAIAANLELHWETCDLDLLTEVERRELRSIPSAVASLI